MTLRGEDGPRNGRGSLFATRIGAAAGRPGLTHRGVSGAASVRHAEA